MIKKFIWNTIDTLFYKVVMISLVLDCFSFANFVFAMFSGAKSNLNWFDNIFCLSDVIKSSLCKIKKMGDKLKKYKHLVIII